VQVTIFYPFTGTKLYDRCVKLDLIDPDKANKFVGDYYTESILRNKTLNGKVNEINAIFNNPSSYNDRLSRIYNMLMNINPDKYCFVLKRIKDDYKAFRRAKPRL